LLPLGRREKAQRLVIIRRDGSRDGCHDQGREQQLRRKLGIALLRLGSRFGGNWLGHSSDTA
jgi:hypothetical protein